MTVRKSIIHGALGALLGAGALAATAIPASAYVACNRYGECWHTPNRYAYPPRLGIVVHPDGWHWRHGYRHYRWREHPGRGYWRNGVWITL